MFFTRQPKESPDELANRLQREGKTGDLERELQKYSVSKLNPKDRESYYHLWGITASQRGDRAAAFQRFKEGIEAFPDSQHLLFSLGQEYEHSREIDQMFECFDRCSFPTLRAAYMLAAARYAYLWDRPEKGSRYVKDIAEAAFKLGIVDDHFVYVRGLPFFSQTWTYQVAFALMQGNFVESDAYITRATSNLTDYDFERLRRFYDCVKSDDYAAVVRESEERLAQWDTRFPAGYQRVQLAALKARSLSEAENADLAVLDVGLGTNDFPWLADVLVIHRAWLFARAGESEKESAEIDRFMARQRMLFEPDHAISFAFLQYQEKLKSEYQNLGSQPGQSAKLPS